MENLTLETLPKAFTHLTNEVSEIKRLLLEKSKEKPAEQFLTIKQAAEFLSLSVPTMYSKVCRNELPVMKRGKRLYFSQAELLQYLKAGRKKTNAEIELEARHYNKKGG